MAPLPEDLSAKRGRMLPILLGNLFEWFDFTIYGFFATTIATQFFPPDNEDAAMLTLTFGLMALGTGMIGLAPTYASAGIVATLILVIGRLLQGFSASGEIGLS